MSRRILVLHGPNLNLLEGKQALSVIDAQLQARANALGIEVKAFQSNHEGVLLDRIAEERGWFDAIIVNAATLAPNAAGLAEAIAMLKRPAIEVALGEGKKSRSALKDVVEKQIYGKGAAGYLEALEALAPKGGSAAKTIELTLKGAVRSTSVEAVMKTARESVRKESEVTVAGRTLGRVEAAPQGKKTIGRARPEADVEATTAERPAAKLGSNGAGRSTGVGAEVIRLTRTGKSLGRRAPGAPASNVLSRESVRRKIAERLSGKLTPAGLATWARSQWNEVQRGAPVESGQRDHLEDVLQQLLLSAQMKASDHQLIELMTQLGE
jgi:3-dehydroquinate dehydratase II